VTSRHARQQRRICASSSGATCTRCHRRRQIRGHSRLSAGRLSRQKPRYRRSSRVGRGRIEPPTLGLRVVHLQGKCRGYRQLFLVRAVSADQNCRVGDTVRDTVSADPEVTPAGTQSPDAAPTRPSHRSPADRQCSGAWPTPCDRRADVRASSGSATAVDPPV
jgi:hypothetical protein